MTERHKPLPEAVPVYEHGWSDYPDRMRQPMDDGKVIDYRIDIPQPAPVFKEALDRFTAICVGGYKYKSKGIGKRNGRRQ